MVFKIGDIFWAGDYKLKGIVTGIDKKYGYTEKFISFVILQGKWGVKECCFGENGLIADCCVIVGNVGEDLDMLKILFTKGEE
jgi:hypothetical protein